MNNTRVGDNVVAYHPEKINDYNHTGNSGHCLIMWNSAQHSLVIPVLEADPGNVLPSGFPASSSWKHKKMQCPGSMQILSQERWDRAQHSAFSPGSRGAGPHHGSLLRSFIIPWRPPPRSLNMVLIVTDPTWGKNTPAQEIQ